MTTDVTKAVLPILPQIFEFNNTNVRVIMYEDNPWFVGVDICTILGLENVTRALSTLDDDERMTLTVGKGVAKRGGARFLNYINESGLYAMIMKSRKPEAKRFRKWVTGTLLPTIRKTGMYVHTQIINKEQSGRIKFLLDTRFPDGKDRPYAWSRFNNHFQLSSYKDLPAAKFDDACKYIMTIPLRGQIEATADVTIKNMPLSGVLVWNILA